MMGASLGHSGRPEAFVLMDGRGAGYGGGSAATVALSRAMRWRRWRPEALLKSCVLITVEICTRVSVTGLLWTLLRMKKEGR